MQTSESYVFYSIIFLRNEYEFILYFEKPLKHKRADAIDFSPFI